jgi:hypothetical protein
MLCNADHWRMESAYGVTSLRCVRTFYLSDYWIGVQNTFTCVSPLRDIRCMRHGQLGAQCGRKVVTPCSRFRDAVRHSCSGGVAEWVCRCALPLVGCLPRSTTGALAAYGRTLCPTLVTLRQDGNRSVYMPCDRKRGVLNPDEEQRRGTFD